eukprot:5564616-Pleurochrysis_carterae.AAC.1
MKRLQHGVIMKVSDVTVHAGFFDILVTAISCIGIFANTPAAAGLIGFNQSTASPEVKSICRLCNCSQFPRRDLGLLYQRSVPIPSCRGPMLEP